MRIAIFDPRIQVPGLKSVLDNSDYYVIKDHMGNYDLDKRPEKFFSVYNFNYREDIKEISGANYDVVVLVYSVRDFNDKSRLDTQYHLEKLLDIVNSNTFKKVIILDNHDSEYDPSLECPYIHADIWLKRNYSKSISYNKSVVPFPFAIFGWVCPLWKVLHLNYSEENKIDRVLWGGHKSGKCNKYLPRDSILDTLGDIVTVINVSNNEYLSELSKSKFSLDLNGIGDPNIRTFEVLSCNSLLIQQRKDLVWPFENDDSFSNETQFETAEECLEKIRILRNNDDVYNRCYENQQYIKNKYFSKEWLSSYIYKYINRIVVFQNLGIHGRLGNVLFQFAATKALALHNGCETVLPPDIDTRCHDGKECLLKYFKLKTQKADWDTWNSFKGKNYTDNNYEEFWDLTPPVSLFGQFESEKYFTKYKKEILDELQFNDDVEEFSNKYLNDILEKTSCKQIVGVHFRFGDYEMAYTNPSWVIEFYNNVKDTYFNSEEYAFLIFAGGNRENSVNDIERCKEVINSNTNVIFCELNNPIKELCIMKNCNHMILTSRSTISWWGGFLNRKENKLIIVPKLNCDKFKSRNESRPCSIGDENICMSCSNIFSNTTVNINSDTFWSNEFKQVDY